MSEQEIQDVLDNIRRIPAEDLFTKYIRPGYISKIEMMATGNLDITKRTRIDELDDEERLKELMAWQTATKVNTKEAYSQFIDSFPNGDNSSLAIAKIVAIDKNEEEIRKERANKVKEIKDDPWRFKAEDIKTKIDEKLISNEDLAGIGIPVEIINALNKFEVNSNETLGKIPREIESGYTEIYFWGIPGSGKSCALAGILSYAQMAGDLSIQDGTGYDYANRLANTFMGPVGSSPVGMLPPRTNEDQTQYLPFDLRDSKGNRHPVALIELSGEIFKCFHKLRAGQILRDDHDKVFKNLSTYLEGSNRKIHFFVIDLSEDPSKIIDKTSGASQLTYLNAAQGYFNNNNTFKKSTDAIYIIATKSDILPCKESEKEHIAADYLKKNFPAFINELKDVCKNYKINDNSALKVIPFSLGKVYFKDICKFNPASSSIILQILKKDTGRKIVSNRFTKFLNR